MKICPNCSAQIADDSRFCSECGKEILQGIVCPHCGASVNESDSFCQNCGKRLKSSQDEPIIYVTEEKTRNNFKKFLPYILGAVALIALCCCGWWLFDNKSGVESLQSSNKVEVKSDNNHSTDESDVSEQIEEDSPLKGLNESFSFNDILALLDSPKNSSYAQNCGLSQIYEDTDEKGCYNIVYGYDVVKGEKNTLTLGYKLEFKSNHAYYFDYTSAGEESMYFCFKDKKEAEHMFNFAKEYGLFEWDGAYYVPSYKMSGGIKHVDKNPREEGNILYSMTAPDEMDGNYIIWIYNLSGERKIDVR